MWRQREGAWGRVHVRLVWVDTEGDPEEEKTTETKKNRRKQGGGGGGGGGRLPNTERFAIGGKEEMETKG